MSNVLYRWGRSAARHPWRMLGAWLIVVLGVVALRSAVGGNPSDNFTIPGTEAQRGIDLLDERFPAQGGVSGQIVFAAPAGRITDPTARAAVEATLAELRGGPNVLGVTDPYDPTTSAVSRDGRIAYTTVRYRVDPPGKAEGKAAEAAVEIGAPGRAPGRDLPDDHPDGRAGRGQGGHRPDRGRRRAPRRLRLGHRGGHPDRHRRSSASSSAWA